MDRRDELLTSTSSPCDGHPAPLKIVLANVEETTKKGLSRRMAPTTKKGL